MTFGCYFLILFDEAETYSAAPNFIRHNHSATLPGQPSKKEALFLPRFVKTESQRLWHPANLRTHKILCKLVYLTKIEDFATRGASVQNKKFVFEKPFLKF